MLVSTVLSLYHAGGSRARLPPGRRPYWMSRSRCAPTSLVALNLSMRFINFYTFYTGAVSDTLVFPPRTSFWPRSASEQPRQPEIV